MVGVSPADSEFVVNLKAERIIWMNLALLIRELPASATEESIRQSIARYTGLVIQRISIASSRHYALLQMRSIEDAVLPMCLSRT